MSDMVVNTCILHLQMGTTRRSHNALSETHSCHLRVPIPSHQTMSIFKTRAHLHSQPVLPTRHASPDIGVHIRSEGWKKASRHHAIRWKAANMKHNITATSYFVFPLWAVFVVVVVDDAEVERKKCGGWFFPTKTSPPTTSPTTYNTSMMAVMHPPCSLQPLSYARC